MAGIPCWSRISSEERFVPNDAQLDGTTQIALITGPNMAGKSTYIRQVALLALLAHTGSLHAGRRTRGSIWWTASSRASARATTLRAANRRSWWR